MTDEEDVVGVFAKHREAYGRLDVLVNNAGVGIGAPMEEIQTKHLDMQLAVNLRALIIGTREGLPMLREAGAEHGKALIVNTASIAGKGGQAWLSIYAATKAAVINFTQSTHREAGGAGIQCTALAPGFVDTPMTEFAKGQVPAEAMIQPSDLGEAVRFLLRTSRNCHVPEIVFTRPGEGRPPPLGAESPARPPWPATPGPASPPSATPGTSSRRSRWAGRWPGAGTRWWSRPGRSGARRSRAPGSASPRPRNTGCSRRPTPDSADGDHAAEAARALLPLLEEMRPHVVVSDILTLAPALAAEKAGGAAGDPDPPHLPGGRAGAALLRDRPAAAAHAGRAGRLAGGDAGAERRPRARPPRPQPAARRGSACRRSSASTAGSAPTWRWSRPSPSSSTRAAGRPGSR